jgi:hypothetical protein
MRPTLRVLVALAIGLPLVASMPGRAIACECARLDPHRIVKQADAIVAARVAHMVTVDQTHTMSSLAVDGVYEGRVGPTLTLRSDIGPAGGSDCAVLYPVGSRIDPLVLDRLPDDTYVVDICAMPVVGQIDRLLGTPRPPPANAPPAAPIPSVGAAVPPSATVPQPQDRINWPAVGGGAFIALALIALAVRRSARGTGAEPPGPGDEPVVAPREDGAPPPEPSG